MPGIPGACAELQIGEQNESIYNTDGRGAKGNSDAADGSGGREGAHAGRTADEAGLQRARLRSAPTDITPAWTRREWAACCVRRSM